MTTIREMWGRETVVPYKSRHGELAGVPLPDWLVGIELEIEDFNPDVERSFGGFKFTEDGSLRPSDNGIGIEAITKPVCIKHVPHLLNAFFKKFEITPANYSERCSTHVHFNVEPMTVDQVAGVCLLYQTVERLLFRFVENDRENNIFCVPWNQCSLTYNVVSKLVNQAGSAFHQWQKYAALNLIPVHTQGTLEFRHLEGTCDVQRITTWISLIAKLFAYSLEHSLDEISNDILKMNTVSNYHSWLNGVFGELTHHLQGYGFDAVLAKGVIDSKLMLVNPIKTKKNIYESMDGATLRPQFYSTQAEILDTLLRDAPFTAADPSPIHREAPIETEVERLIRLNREAMRQLNEANIRNLNANGEVQF